MSYRQHRRHARQALTAGRVLRASDDLAASAALAALLSAVFRQAVIDVFRQAFVAPLVRDMVGTLRKDGCTGAATGANGLTGPMSLLCTAPIAS